MFRQAAALNKNLHCFPENRVIFARQTNKKFNVCFFLMISFGGGLWVYSSGLSVDAIEMKCGVDFRSKG